MTYLARCPDCSVILISREEIADARCWRCTKLAAAKLIAWLVGSVLTVVIVYGTFTIRAVVQWMK